ncbi:GNAT family N-acetyltransferase [Allokutzneria albata]|uniref:Acetyltransferase (GNAT) family protein n=1 Tax=Allokutzneria albata TaxID=211114 RepID=A0A1G9T266_ALLAB|nr:GNAT family N-acetyltransferase [Allokutzneria albata]SDM41750.1 Acetyltransferase (GNAT) family protein [Allokutzneria albata]
MALAELTTPEKERVLERDAHVREARAVLSVRMSRSAYTCRVRLQRVRADDVPTLKAFLSEVDLTLSGLHAPTVRLWVERSADGKVVGSTGYEISEDGRHALVRSVGVSPSMRSSGRGSDLARFAFDRAAEEGAHQVCLFQQTGQFDREVAWSRSLVEDALAT